MIMMCINISLMFRVLAFLKPQLLIAKMVIGLWITNILLYFLDTVARN